MSSLKAYNKPSWMTKINTESSIDFFYTTKSS